MEQLNEQTKHQIRNEYETNANITTNQIAANHNISERTIHHWATELGWSRAGDPDATQTIQQIDAETTQNQAANARHQRTIAAHDLHNLASRRLTQFLQTVTATQMAESPELTDTIARIHKLATNELDHLNQKQHTNNGQALNQAWQELQTQQNNPQTNQDHPD